MKETITVIDSVMGTGKTHYIINHINTMPLDQKVIVVTPYMEECRRFNQSVTTRNLTIFDEESEGYNKKDGTKMKRFREAIFNDENIVVTHSLFLAADTDLIESIDNGSYTLILDEVLDVVEPVPKEPGDVRRLLDTKMIRVGENRKLHWMATGYAGKDDVKVRDAIETGNCYLYENALVLQQYPAEFFRAFDKTFILTYMWDSARLRVYCKANDLQCEIMAVENGERLVPYDRQREDRKAIFDLMTIHTGKRKYNHNTAKAYSGDWLRRLDSQGIQRLTEDLKNFFEKVAKAKGGEVYWSTLKEVGEKMKSRRVKVKDKNGDFVKYASGKIKTRQIGTGYNMAELHWNVRATNDWDDRRAIAYLYNRIPRNDERQYFSENGEKLNYEQLAVSDFLQWAFRSRIRKGEPIDVYLPSSRMRAALIKWVNHEI